MMRETNSKFNKFDRHELENGLRYMVDNDGYSEELKNAVRQEIIYRIEHPEYEITVKARKVLTGGYNF